MADQTVRTIYEAVVNQAQVNLGRLARETDKTATSVDKLDQALDSAGSRDVRPDIDVDIADAEKTVKQFTKELDELASQRTEADVDADISKAQKKRDALVNELEILGRMSPSPQVDADVKRAQKQLDNVNSRLDVLDGMRAEAVADADVSDARKHLDEAEAHLKALQGAKAEMVVAVDADSVDESLEGVGDAAEDAGADAGERAGNAILEGLNSTPVVGAVAGIVAAAGGYITATLVGEINDHLRGEDFFGAATGLDEATSRKFGAAAGAAYGNAWGESVQANLETARMALSNGLIDEDATGREIQVVTEQLTAMSELLGIDVVQGAEAAGNMMKNGLAANAEEAFDVIITGQQEGLNRSDDWIDTLREYSSMFESLGLTGAEAGGLIGQAMEEGARNTDVAADALKEFSIRAQDDSQTTRDAFEALKLDADEMGSAIAEGGDTAAEGLDTVLDALRDMEDPVQRNLAGVALFGTMWEDTGNGAAILAMDLDGLGDAWVNVGDTSEDAMQRMQDNAATAWEKVKRNVTDAATQTLGGIAQAFEDPMMDLSNWVSTHTSDILAFLIDLGYGFFDLARAAVEFAATTVEVMGDVAGSLDGIVDGVGKTVEAFGRLTGDQDMIDLGLSIQGAADDMDTFSENADGAADTLRNTVGGAIDDAEAKFEDFTGPALMQASLNDAINEMVGRLDEFSAVVEESGGTVTINGEALPAEEALNDLITEVSESNGTVDINGETVLAEEALDHVMGLAAEGAEITVTANTGPAEEEITALISGVNAAGAAGAAAATVPVGADTTPADTDIGIWGSGLNDVPAKVYVQADLYGVEATMEAFYAEMQEQDWEIEINGETVGAEEALGILLEEVNNGEGSVTINGMTFPADTSLMALIEAINMSEGEVTINGDPAPANAATDSAKSHADGTTGTMDVDGDNSGAVSATESAEAHADGTTGTIDVDANTWGANAAIEAAARTRTATINVRARLIGGSAYSVAMGAFRSRGGVVGGLAEGGVAGAGYGRVPAPSAPYGVDNVLWPTTMGLAGGGTLTQPLAGGEWVINPISSRQHDATLRAINEGASRAELAASLGVRSSNGSLNVYPQVAPEADPTVFGRRVGESLGHLLEGVRP